MAIVATTRPVAAHVTSCRLKIASAHDALELRGLPLLRRQAAIHCFAAGAIHRTASQPLSHFHVGVATRFTFVIHHSSQAAGRYAVVYEVQGAAAAGSSAKLWKGRPSRLSLQVPVALPAGRGFRVRADFALYDAPVTSSAEPLAVVELELEPCNGQNGPSPA